MKHSEDYRHRVYKNYARNFKDCGEIFDRQAAERWGKAFDWYLRGWLPVDKKALIVDVGCGSGKLLYFLKQRGYSNVFGIDLSPSQVALAKQVLESVKEINALDFLKGTKKRFDVILGLDIIEHFYKDELFVFFDGCLSALNSGGRIIVQTPNADTPWGTYHRYNDITHELCFQHNSIKRILNLCGFHQVEIREQGPVPFGYSLKSTLRWIIWQSIRQGLKLYNMAETGNPGKGVFTRVFIASGVKT